MTRFVLKFLFTLKFFIIWSFSLVIYSEILSIFKLYTKIYFIYFWIFTIFMFIFVFKINKKIISFNTLFNLSLNTYIFTFILFLLLFCLCLIYPPNNYDSMTYHLPRVFYWIQNESLDNFATNNLRQLIFPPFSGMIFSLLFYLANSDYLFNFSSILFNSYFMCFKNIISELNSKSNATSAFIFLLTMPMVICSLLLPKMIC